MSRRQEWLRDYGATGPCPGIRMVCFPHAGGTASAYAAWRDGLAGGVEDVELVAVRYPAREDRLLDPPVPSLRAMARMVAADLENLHAEKSLPLVLFGHSMGGSIAHEVAVLLRGAGLPVVLLLVSAGSQRRHSRRDDTSPTRSWPRCCATWIRAPVRC